MGMIPLGGGQGYRIGLRYDDSTLVISGLVLSTRRPISVRAKIYINVGDVRMVLRQGVLSDARTRTTIINLRTANLKARRYILTDPPEPGEVDSRGEERTVVPQGITAIMIETAVL